MTGEAAGLAMGLCELGSKSASAIEDTVAYAQVHFVHVTIVYGMNS